MSGEWIRRLYSFAVKPTLAFYYDVPLPEAIRRIMDGRPTLKYYEAGMDLDLASDPEDSFRFYALRLYEAGLIKSTPNKIIAENTDWRFFDELKRELKA